MEKRMREFRNDLRNGKISRREVMKAALALGISVPAANLLAGCAPAESPPAVEAVAAATSVPPKAPGKIIFGSSADITSMDPAVVQNTGIDEAMYRNIYDGLLSWTGKPGEYAPGLATEWGVAEDQITWTFKLRPEIKFSDGTNFDADVVKYNLDRQLEKATFRIAPHVKEVKVVDKGTVQLVSPQPDAGFLDWVSWPTTSFVSVEAYKKYGEDLGKNPVGTGPFLFDSWVPGEQVVLKKNENYWGDKAQVDEVVMRPISEYGSRILALEAGDIDTIGNVAVADVARLRNMAELRVDIFPSARCMNLIPNLTKPGLTKELRAALNYAIDREAICTNVMLGLTKPSYNFTSSVNFGFRDPNPKYVYNVEKAKELLASAGVAAGTKLCIMCTEGRYYGDRQVAEAVQGMWNAIGMDTEVWLVEWPTYAQWMWGVGPEDPNVVRRDFALTDWGAQDPVFAIKAEATGDWPPVGGNSTFTKDAELERLIVEAGAALDKDKYVDLLGQLQDLIAENSYREFIMESSQVYASKKGVEGFEANPNNHWNFRKIRWAA